MDDHQFLTKLNAISRREKFRLPRASAKAADSETLGAWARFLQLCVREGVALSDERWKRLRVERQSPAIEFVLIGDADPEPDADFRVGLQLLMGMLDVDDPDNVSR